MTRAWLSLGSNIDREHNIRAAVAALAEAYGPLRLSQVYESEAVGFAGDPFYNMVVGLDTTQEVTSLVGRLHDIEQAQGRVRGADRFAPRTLDIDLLTYGDRVMREPGIQLPRDEITRFAFVLLPLSEVAGDERHPLTGKSYRELWQLFDKTTQPLWPVELALS